MINKNIITAVAVLLLGSAFQANAQTDIVVSGTVKDTYGNPLPGVIVSANHKDVYITDKNGQYKASVDKKSELTFSLLGYKQYITPAAVNTDVVLEDDAHKLSEVVNLGYSKSYREVLTESISTVYGSTLERSCATRLQQTLSGQLSGLTTIENSFEPTYEEMSMYIRGLSTIHGGTAGVVIDGVLYDSYAHDILYRISPEEVESISVLKDGASQTIYGLKGANGLIVINTKRGTPGKLQIGVNFSETVEQASTQVKSFDSYTFAQMRNQAAVNDGLGENFYFSESDIEGFKNHEEGYANTDWYNTLLKKAANMQRLALSATGGNEHVKFYSNFNMLHQGSFFNTDQTEYNPNNQKFRINFRSNIDIKANDWLNFWMNIAGSVVRSHTPNGSVAWNSELYSEITKMPSFIYGPVTPTIYDEAGVIAKDGGDVTTSTLHKDSPYGNLNRSGYNNQTNTNIYGQAGFRIDLKALTPGLWLGGSVGYLSYITATLSNTQSYERYTQDSFGDISSFTKLGTTNNTTLSYGKGTALYSYTNYKGEGGWTRDFGRNHFDADAYFLYQKFDDHTGNNYATYDYRRMYSALEFKYDFDKRYAIKLSTGYSASDYFPTATRWMWTPGVSAAWIASNESFIKDGAPWLSLLKIRGSYAITGNDSTGYDRYQYKDQVQSVGGGTVPYLGYYTNEKVYGNDALKPEAIKKMNVGIDLGLFNSLEINFDVFKENMDNGIAASTALVPLYQGISLGSYPITNFAKYENKGWELGISYRKRFNADWAVNFAGHLDYNKNKVVYIGESPYDETYYAPYRQEGFCYGQSFGYLVDWSNGNGIFNFQEEIDNSAEYEFGTPRVGDLKYQDLNNDGVINEKDKAAIGNGSIPNYNFAFNLGASWRSFELNLLFQGVGEYYRNYQSLLSVVSENDGVYTDSMVNAWTPERWANGETISFPALSTTSTTNSQTNDYLLRNASFIRLKNAELAYRLPKKVCDFLNASQFKVYLSGQNLFTIDGIKSKDMPVEGSAFAFPVYRMYRIGLNITF